MNVVCSFECSKTTFKCSFRNLPIDICAVLSIIRVNQIRSLVMNFTESMKNLVVISCNTTYELTGYRYFDRLNMVYWYESSIGIWLLGDSMKYADGRIK